jgi:hypothetical protein
MENENMANLTEKVIKDAITKKEITDMLHHHVVEVVFMKVDGTKRTMRCTLVADMLPVSPAPAPGTPRKEPNPNQVAAWDIEAEGWRSFRVDSIVRFNIVSNID